MCTLSILYEETFPMQVTFQAVLATNGRESFAVFIYDNLERIHLIFELDFIEYLSIGFNKGDRSQFSCIGPLDSCSDSLKDINVYRIDGECCA